MSQFPPAARLGDPIAHSNANARLLAKVVGIAAGAAALGALCAGTIAAGVTAGLAAVGTVVTGGLAAPILAGAVVLTGALATFAVSMAGGAIGEKIADWLVPETWDVTGAITTGSPDVFVNGIPAARATNAVPLDEVVCGKHTITPVNLIAQGAAVGPKQTVINEALAARKGDKVVCGATIHAGSPNVFIGGAPETVRDYDDEVNPLLRAALFIAEARNLLKNIKCLWKLVKDPKALVKNAECMLKAAQAAGSAAMTVPAILGNPVHIATGAKLLADGSDLDFVLPGVLPVAWQRIYNSLDERSEGPLGRGWSTLYTVQLHLDHDPQGRPVVTYYDADGRDIQFSRPAPGQGLFSVAEGIGVLCSEGGDYVVVTAEGMYQWFGQAPAGSVGDAAAVGVLHLQRIEDRNGNYHALRYGDDGVLTHVADSAGRLLEFLYVPGTARLQQIHLRVGADGEAAQALVNYCYDAAGQLAEVRDRAGQTTRRFTYANGRMASHQLPGGLLCSYEWQEFAQGIGNRPGPHARVVRHWTDDGEAYAFEYGLHGDGSGSTQVTDGLGRRQQWHWNADHEITRHTDALGHTTTQVWGTTKELLGHTDALGRSTTYTYDDAGNLTSETDALGRTHRQRWSPGPASLLVATEDPGGGTWRYQYDDHGNLVAETDPLGHVTRYANDDRGLPVLVTDAHGGRKQLRWDARGLLTAYTDCSGKTTRYTYDAQGHLHQEIDALGQSTVFERDPLGRLLQLTLPDGAQHQYRYDAAGQCVIATDALGHTTSYSYNQRGQLTGRSKAVGALTSNIQLGYDAARRLSALVNENRQAYRFAYDAADRLVAETRIDGTRQVLHYDAAHQVVGVTEHPMPQGQGDAVPGHAEVQPIHTQLVRDAAGQLVQKNVYTPSAAAQAGAAATQAPPELQARIDYAYSPTGDLLTAQHSTPLGEVVAQHTWQYDALGQVLQETAGHAVQGQQRSSALHHQYDALGNRIGTRLPDGRALNHLYYGSGHLHQINLDGAVLADIERDDLHREVLRTQGRLASRFAYDPVGRKAAAWVRPAMLRVGRGIGTDQGADGPWSPHSADWSQRLQQRHNAEDVLLKRYSYDGNGELTSVEHSQQGHTLHRYDQGGRITQTLSNQPERSEHFHYDLAGNRISALEESSLSSQGRGWVQNNRVKVLQDKRYDYDGFGRLIRKRIGSHTEQHYRYDHQHRLTQVAVVRAGKDGQPQSQVFSYQYDALGRRIAKTDSFGTTHFTWEGMRLLQESRGGHTSTYVYEPGSYVPLARIDGSGGIEPHAAAAHALGGGSDNAQGKQASVPTTNPGWSDRFNVGAAANDGPTDGLTRADAKTAATAERAAQVYYFHTQPSGLPEELSDNSGHLVWTAQYRTWGSTVREEWQSYDEAGRPVQLLQQQSANQTVQHPQNLRMQGQYLDRETGLHYNTFRYYDADLGAFTTPDPIGLSGGLNLHQYAPNPISWIDPWGWSRECGAGTTPNKKTSYDGVSRRDALRQAKRDAGIPNSQQPIKIARDQLDDGRGNKIFNSKGQPVTAREYHYTTKDGKSVVIQEHGLGHTKATKGHGAEPHFNVRPIANTRTGDVKGTHGHYNF